MTVHSAAALAAPPVLPAAAFGRSDGNAATSGFAEELLVAGLSDSTSSLPVTLLAPHRGAKDARQPSRGEDKQAAAAPGMIFLPAALTLPLRIMPLSWEMGSQGQSTRMQASLKPTNRQSQAAPATGEAALPAEGHVETPAPAAARETPAEAGKSPISQTADADSVRAPSNPPEPADSASAPAGELAFAARVQPTAAADANPGISTMAAQREIAAPALVAPKKSAESDSTDPTAVQPIAPGAGSSLASYGHSFASAEIPSHATAAPPAPATAAPVRFPDASPKPAAVPLKDISLQVAQPGAQKVEVRMVQQSGELRVAVRTGDSELAHGLQQGLSDLVGRLQETGIRAEAWRPGVSTVQSGPVFESRTSPSGSQTGDSQPYSGGSQQQQGERRQNQPQRPGWVEELENSIAGGERSQGATYGIGT